MRLSLVPLALVAVTTSCMRVDYIDWIEPPETAPPAAFPSRIEVDFQASYVEMGSDAGEHRTPSVRYDRVELLSAIASRWNERATTETSTPVRVILMANVTHLAGDIAGTVIHGSTGVGLLLGLPFSCGYSNVTLVMQTPNGDTLVSDGKGSWCSGLYYPQDHLMTSLAEGVNDALRKLEPIQMERLKTRVPRLPELPTGATQNQGAIADRVVWWAQPTPAFPKAWGDGI